MQHPEWALKHKRKGTELRLLNGTYYLYEVKSKWNPDKKRPKKITGKLLGKITPEGFIQSAKYVLSQSHKIQSVIVKEYGATYFIKELMSDVINTLQKTFPLLWKEIFIISSMRLLYQAPIKNIEFNFQHSYLSTIYSEVSVSDKKVSSVLRGIGIEGDSISAYLKGYIVGRKNDYMIIDATRMLSYSEDMEIAKRGYNSQREYEAQVNLLFIYSRGLKIPVYYRCVAGNIREVKAFRLTLQESGIKDAVIIADKGFYSEDNIEQLEVEGLKYIIPLRRSSKLIDYSRVSTTDKGGFEGYFKFNGRYIWYYSYEINKRKINIYLDEHLRRREEHDYLERIETETETETYTIEGFHRMSVRFGTFAIITNMTQASAEEIYVNYKSRNDIEVMIDAMKDVLKADSSYMRDQISLQGWLFITFITLQVYYRIYKLLSEKRVLSKISPQDLLKYLAEIKKVKINDTWHTSEITNKTKKLMEKLDVHIT